MSAAAETRFAFGKNWRNYLNHFDEERLAVAKQSLRDLLGLETLAGKKFLDIGSGSGIFSLAAHSLGADVFSFDYDADSVSCTRELWARAGQPANWQVCQGSVLDAKFMSFLPDFDIVYSWGVLHHTGEMWKAIDFAAKRVRSGGCFAIAIYNDQGWISRYWSWEKRLYNRSAMARRLFTLAHFVHPLATSVVWRAFTGRLRSSRAMVYWNDYLDWLGGYPFEVSTPERIRGFFDERGFQLARQNLTKRHGCNEFVFVKR